MCLRICSCCRFIFKIFIMFIVVDFAAKICSSFHILTSMNLRRLPYGSDTSFGGFYDDPEFEYVDRWFVEFLRSYEPASGIKAVCGEWLSNIKGVLDLAHVAESYTVGEININYASSDARRTFVDPELYIDVEEVYTEFDSSETRRTLVDPELYVDVENSDSSLQESNEDPVDLSEIDFEMLLEDWDDEDYTDGSISKAPTPTKIPSSLPTNHMAPSSAPYGFPISSPLYDSRKSFSFPTYSPAMSYSDPPTPASPSRDPAKPEVLVPSNPDIVSDEFEFEEFFDEDFGDESPTLSDSASVNDSSKEIQLLEEDIVVWQQWCMEDCDTPIPQDSIRCPLLLIFNVLILGWVIHCIFSEFGYKLDKSLILTFPMDNHTKAQDEPPYENPKAKETQTEEWEVIQEREMSDKDDFVYIN